MEYPVLENDFLQVVTDPRHGGRVIRFYDKRYDYEHLWYDPARVPADPAMDYDSNFAGGMDELLPNDLPEGEFPDHGELWMTALEPHFEEDVLVLEGKLTTCNLFYRREMSLRDAGLICRYVIVNNGEKPLDFLWKLHGAMQISPGDIFEASAGCVQAADPGDWSTAENGLPRLWQKRYVIPEMDGGSDFFFLTDLTDGYAGLLHADGRRMECIFDRRVFPALWVFASFGRLNDSRTLILEPCTNYPMLIGDAVKNNCCAHLEPGAAIKTSVFWRVS